MRILIVFILFIMPIQGLFYAACSSKENVILTPGRSLQLPTDNLYESRLQFFSEQNKPYFGYLNRDALQILHQNLNTGEIVQRVPLDYLDTIYDLEEYFVRVAHYTHSLDSIFAFVGGRTVYLLDAEGQITDYWTLNLSFAKGNYVLESYSYRMPLLYRNHKVYCKITRRDLHKGTDENRKKLYASPFEVVFSIRDHPPEVIYMSGKWPTKYQSGKFYYYTIPHRTINDQGQLIYAFPQSRKLFVFEKDQLVKTIPVKSEYDTSDNWSFRGNTSNVSDIKKFFVTAPRYGIIRYDPFREVYYRVFNHNLNDFTRKNGLTVKKVSEKPWSLMILNKNFEIINEIKIDHRKYSSTMLIPTQEGIWLKSTAQNEHSVSNTLQLFKLVLQ